MDLRMSPTPVPGVVIAADGITVQVPALKLGKLKAAARSGALAHLDRLAAGGFSQDAGPMDELTALVHTCLVRNYPHLTPEDVDELIDMRNMGEFFAAITGQTVTNGAHPPGEAASPSALSTSESSTG